MKKYRNIGKVKEPQEGDVFLIERDRWELVQNRQLQNGYGATLSRAITNFIIEHADCWRKEEEPLEFEWDVVKYRHYADRTEYMNDGTGEWWNSTYHDLIAAAIAAAKKKWEEEK